MVTVQLLGGAALRSGDMPIGGPPAQRHRIALLTLVVVAWPQPLSRDRAVAMLWPERDTANSRRLLNLAVHVLRGALGDGTITSSGDALLLNPARVRCDLHELRIAMASGDLEGIVHGYAGPLLDGFHLDDSIEFEYWLGERRRELDHAYIAALRSLAELQERSGDVYGRVSTARRLVAADPHSSVYALAMIRALEAAGDRFGAIQHAADHAHRLSTDLELEPDVEVQALAERLRTAPSTRASASTTAVRKPLPSVAVMPFRNLSTDPENACFADGITEDVIANLSKIRALKVISHTSVMHFKERRPTLKEIGVALGATVVLAGSVRRAGDRVRIVAQLMDIDSDRHLWSETYDRQMVDIFSIQSEVALQIASALEAELSPDERTRVRHEPTADLQAYHLFLQGRQLHARYTTESMLGSIPYYERAIARDAGFASAHAGLALLYAELAEVGTLAPEPAYARAAEEVAHALRLDPDLDSAHCTLGFIRAVRDFDWIGAEQEFERALELNPNGAETCDMYGRVCAGIERYDQAIALLERAAALDPLVHRIDIVTTLLRAGRIDEAIARGEAALELEPHERTRATLGWAYFLEGRREEGLGQLERAVAMAPETLMWLAQLGEAHAMVGNEARAREILHTLEERSRETYVPPYYFAYVHTGLGEAERALGYLERAVAERAGPAYSIKGSFLFAPLRTHPRFRALLREMKLA
ncbi:MAG TPA: BTAD domain-containing putative transcriptional regulator [Gemmatimonadaceae bacterium]|nr:BTAD domain-containing putative transcriptional regulator [Gemmatimonadaceae bacterium]